MKLPKGTLDLAISQALKSAMTHRHGAVIFKSGKIIGAGYNVPMTTKHKSRAVSIHSEKDCMKGLRGDQIYGANILAVRVTPTGSLSHGAPCKGCKKLMKRKGIERVFWFDESGDMNCTFLN
jgi:deoxycytidylate deaminase